MSKANHGDATFSPITGISAEILVSRRVAIGASYSGFSVDYDYDYSYPMFSNVDFNERILAAYVCDELFLIGPTTTFFAAGIGYYEIALASEANSTFGAYAAIGERLYVSRKISVSLQVEYHFPDLGSDDDRPPTDELLRVFIGVEIWLKNRGQI
jgi:hypothetical protein